MATAHSKLIPTVKQQVFNNKHPLYKCANKAYIVQWVGSGDGCDRPPTNKRDSLVSAVECCKNENAPWWKTSRY